jgi:hypothetical protein
LVDPDAEHPERRQDDHDDGDGRRQDAEVKQQGREAIGAGRSERDGTEPDT